MVNEGTARIDLHLNIKNEGIDFLLQRFQEFDPVEKAKVWKIRILHPNKRIDRCNVWYNDVRLRLWDTDTSDFVRTIEEGGGANFVIPATTAVSDDGVVTIHAFNTVIRSEKFSDIEVSRP